jgi:hypothetical protein
MRISISLSITISLESACEICVRVSIGLSVTTLLEGRFRSLATSKGTATDHRLRRVPALYRLAAARGWLASGSGASSHRLPLGSGRDIVAAQRGVLIVAKSSFDRRSARRVQCPLRVKSRHADRVPNESPHSTMREGKWVVLIARSTGSALRGARPPNLHITPDVRRDLVYAASATGSL